jgi:hypothetical protein
MKLKRMAAIALSGMIPLMAAAADGRNVSAPTNFVGTISAVRGGSGQMIPILTLDRPLPAEGPNGNTKQRTYMSLTMTSAPGAPKRPVLGDGDPFAKWNGKRVRVEGELAQPRRGATPMFHVTSIEAEK